jgi:NitT/TauT family transport system substrate-binding protein
MIAMSPKRWVLFVVLAWIVTVTVLHLWLNLHAFDNRQPQAHAGLRFRVGFLPVVTLTCPVTHFINENTSGDGMFEPVRFNGWPELKSLPVG